jgi:hypothetical protein
MVPSPTEIRKLSSEPNVEYIDERIDVVTVFSQEGGNQDRCVPRKMKFRNRVITFTELGFRHPTSKGHRYLHIFDVTDGCAEYRLEFDSESLTWTLISTAIVE